MYLKYYIFLTFFLGIFTFHSVRASNPETIVNQFGDLMTNWCESGDDECRIEIEDLVSGKIGCRVDDGIMKIFVKRDKSELLTNGPAQIINYLNGFTNSIEKGLRYTHKSPKWEVEMREPTAFSEKEEEPLRFVSMAVKTSGDFWYEGTNLFFVRGNQITKIEDFKGDNSLSKAISLYSAKIYDEAFSLFRKLAYQHPDNYEAQYYTAIMEIKKQGCKNLAASVRDTEAAWWIVRGMIGQGPVWIKDRMTKLYSRFTINEKVLPFNTHGLDYYVTSLETTQLISEGLMVYKKKGKYGFINELGKEVIPCIYDLVRPFDKLGHAKVIRNGKIGYVNREGEIIIPTIYDDGLSLFQNGKTMVIKAGELQIIDEKGSHIETIGKGFDYIMSPIFKNGVYAHHRDQDKYYVYSLNGEIQSVEDHPFKIDLTKHCYFVEDKDGKRIAVESYGWDNE